MLKHTIEKYTWQETYRRIYIDFVNINIKLTATQIKERIKWYLKCYYLPWISVILFLASVALAIFILEWFILVGLFLGFGIIVTYILLPISWENDKRYYNWKLNIITHSSLYLDIQMHNKIELAKKKVWEDENKLTVCVHNYCKYKDIRDLESIIDYLKDKGVIKDEK